MSVAFFSSFCGLENISNRCSVGRIPEVSVCLKGGQVCVDALEMDFDMISFFNSSNDIFMTELAKRKITLMFVWTGLFERFVKTRGLPEYIVVPDFMKNIGDYLNYNIGLKDVVKTVYESEKTSFFDKTKNRGNFQVLWEDFSESFSIFKVKVLDSQVTLDCIEDKVEDYTKVIENLVGRGEDDFIFLTTGELPEMEFDNKKVFMSNLLNIDHMLSSAWSA